MPNWCSNCLTVSGTPSSLKIFSLLARGTVAGRGDKETPLSFQALRPRPENEEDWYNWQICNWGTKWDVDNNTDFTENPESLVYIFDTAWSPPEALLYYLVEKYAHLNLCFHLTYHEGGMDFYGEIQCSPDGSDDISFSGSIHDDYKKEILPDWMPDLSEWFDEDEETEE